MAKRTLVAAGPDIDEIWRDLIAVLGAASDMASGAQGIERYAGGQANTSGAQDALKGLGGFNLAGYARQALNSVSNRPVIPSQQIDYNELARAISERPTELFINSRKFAYATAADGNNAINDRKAALHRGRGR